MTKQEALEFIKAERDLLEYANQLAGKRVIDFAIAIADYLLADDEPAKVDASLRGWVLWERTSEDDMRFIMWASDDGLCESPDSLRPMFSWKEFEGRHEKVRAMTPADLEVTE